MSAQLFAITGITGHVGGHAADALLKAGHRVRGVVRNENSDASKALAAKGVELAVATFTDTAALTKAFTGVDGVFILTPPDFSSSEPRKESKEQAENTKEAVLAAKVPRVVLLSSIGAHIPDETIIGPIIKCYDLEQIFFPLVSQGIAVLSLRAGYFAENTLSAINHAKATSTFNSLLPLDASITPLSTKDIGIQAAKLLTDKSTGLRIVELTGPHVTNYKEIAETFFKLSGKTLPINQVPVEARAAVVASVGASPAIVTSFIYMLDGVVSGKLSFENKHETVKATQTYEEFLAEVLAKH